MNRIRVWLPLLITTVLCAALPPTSYAEQAGSARNRVAIASLDAGGEHTCALLTTGRVRCWGSNSAGQLGSATDFGSSTPVPDPQPAVALGARATAVAAGDTHTCALLTDGKVRCWGANFKGQLGTTAFLGTATPTVQPAVPLGARAVAVSAAGSSTCALLATGKVRCWGDGGSGVTGSATGASGPTPQPPIALGARATAISTGTDSACAVLVTRAVRCWGSNRVGQLGSVTRASTGVPSPTPLSAVPLGAPATAVTVGKSFACALLSTGRVRCWGANESGQLASAVNNGLSQAANPFPMPAANLGAGATAVAAGADHACAVLVSGTVRCWGYNWFGQLGSTTHEGTATATPAPQPALSFAEGGAHPAVVAPALGDFHSCALTVTGHVHCWGTNNFGQLGAADPSSWTATPIQVPLSGVRTRAATTLTAAARPGTDRRAPYAFAVSGRVGGAFAIDAATCTGTVRLLLRRGTHTLASKRVALRATCTWRATLTAPTAQLARGRNALTVRVGLSTTPNLRGATRTLRVTAIR